MTEPSTDWLDVERQVSPAVAAVVLTLAAVLGFAIGAIVGASQNDAPPTTPRAVESPLPTASPTPKPTAAQISLAADQQSVGRNEEIRLTGKISTGAADVALQVQRSLNGGDWSDFGDPPVSTESKSDGTFSVRVQTGRTGTVEFRVRGEIEGQPVESEAVAVEIG